MQLRQLMRAIPDARLFGTDEVHIEDIVYDSRRVERGSLFVAVPTVGGNPRTGGFPFIAAAIQRGAAAVVAQSPVADIGVPVVVVPDARAALADLAVEFFDHPSHQMQLFAVTGTDGKTTTTYLLDAILNAAGRRTGLVGTIETKIGDEREFNADRMTTPESLDLQRLLRRMANAGVTHVSLEASSHALALQRLRGSVFAACALTNITADHVEFHGTWEAYFAAKVSLFTDLARGRLAILNADDEHFDRISGLVGTTIIPYSLRGAGRITGDGLEFGREWSNFHIHVDGAKADVRIPLAGRHNVSNALAAAGLAVAAGIPLHTIAQGLSVASPPPGRMQHIHAGQDFDVVVDYAHTPNAFRSVLSSVQCHSSSDNRVIAVFGAAGNRDRGKRPLFAQIAREYADYFIITNEDPFGESADAIIAEVVAGVDGSEEGRRFECEPDRARAIQKALKIARPGDTVVILGKGHEQSIVVNGHREPWSDSQVAQRALESRR